ncbi:pyridoxamine 5'-phosphate oxidase family protein [Streptomyces xiangluensis]|uniref:Pyridoxamine 5'-phosphate oxidase family protein n=1 Tax=Streptomyces xiangluensis TaxID=2665720 RepID=A0ABV8Z0I9_9ACTN
MTGTTLQKRGRKIVMTPEERDAFLAEERTCRVATTTADGPHLTALWFVWDGTALWLYSITGSKRWADLAADPRVAILIDAGREYDELRGVELRGSVEIVGEVPRTGQPHPELEVPEGLFARKYTGGDTLSYDHRHAWLRLTPEKITSWDFRKLAAVR